MLLSLVIVAVEITSFTVACFSLVALLCFLLQHKKKSQQKTKQKKLWTKKGTKSVCGPPTFNCTRGGSPPPLSPSPTVSHQTQKWGSRGVCRFVKRWNQVFAQFVRPFSSGDRRKLNQESIVFRDCFSRNNNLVPYVINHLFPPLVPPSSSFCAFPTFKLLLLSLYLSPHPPPLLPRLLKCC